MAEKHSSSDNNLSSFMQIQKHPEFYGIAVLPLFTNKGGNKPADGNRAGK